jgi:phage gp36-like protein
MLPASYSTVVEVIGRYPPIGSVTAISSLHVANAIGAEQARIDGMLGARYATPFSPCPPVIEMIAGDLAILRLIDTRVLLLQQTKAATDWTAPWKASFDLLIALAAGKIDLVTASGTIIPQLPRTIGELWSSTMTSTPTFIGQRVEEVRDRDSNYQPFTDRERGGGRWGGGWGH